MAGLFFCALLLVWATNSAQLPSTAQPRLETTDTLDTPIAYIPNDTCMGCHPEQARDWTPSHHARAMASASPTTVRGDFDASVFRHDGVTSRFFRRGEKYFVHTDGVDGKLSDFEIQYTFGVGPLQQYLIAMPGGRLQALGIAWDDQKKRWFHLHPDVRTPPGDTLHWTGRYQTANTLCIVCHTTAYERRYEASTDSFASTWQEPNVSCQACHGPGEAHLQWAKAGGADRENLAFAKTRGLTTARHAGDSQAARDMCTPCHSRRSELSALGAPGPALMDHFLPSVLREGLYHADGQQLDEVFVDGSFRQSKMFQMGVGCTNCHNPHTGKLRQQGNALCLQCHSSQRNPAFPSAAGNYDSPNHHFHGVGSPGARCVNCHMPSKVYMGIQARLDHSLRVPRPDLSAKTGAPNACNGCHAKQTSQWAAGKVAQWYGPNRQRDLHHGVAFANYRAGKAGAADELLAVIADPRASAIVRATALDALRGDGTTGLPIRIQALSDPSGDVRAAAADGLVALEPMRRMEALAPLLGDPLRAVRMAAANSLSTVPRQQLDAGLRAAFDQAANEYLAAQGLNLDMPGARLNMAVMYQNMGKMDLAERHYRGALTLDPDFSPARLDLAHLLAGQGRTPEALLILKDGLSRVPSMGEMHYALGLLLAQSGDPRAAIDALKQAAKLLPRHARVLYNLGLAHQQSGNAKAAEQALLKAARADETDPDMLYALAAFYFHGQRFTDAQAWVVKLKSIRAQDPRLPGLERALNARAEHAAPTAAPVPI